MFWNSFYFNFGSFWIFSNDQIWRKTNYGKKHAFLLWSYAKFQSSAKFYSHVSP